MNVAREYDSQVVAEALEVFARYAADRGLKRPSEVLAADDFLSGQYGVAAIWRRPAREPVRTAVKCSGPVAEANASEIYRRLVAWDTHALAG